MNTELRVTASSMGLRLGTFGTAAAVVVAAAAAGTAAPCDRDDAARASPGPAPTSPAVGDGSPPEVTSLERRAWADTFSLLARRADSGSVEAARLALEMRHHGPLIYGMHFEATGEQVQRWQQRLVCSTPPCRGQG